MHRSYKKRVKKQRTLAAALTLHTLLQSFAKLQGFNRSTGPKTSYRFSTQRRRKVKVGKRSLDFSGTAVPLLLDSRNG
ncbi:hypothetical protein PoB_001658800 [Plakobranchus ocellatus]|uniref:Secreted protein n=1 Tax=Plakobranchus ocellatus TaxID=259542 RepID=A0AAV3Z6I6_9GAST|nr:hypothetical protein PoB_001658800 [Plakobranchus ocellatus]